MGRVCGVDGCCSGRNADIVRRRKLGVRQASIFTIPKRNNALQAWSRAIGKDLSAKDAICELHFAHNSFVKEDRTVLRDGTVHLIPRQKYALVPNAVPIAISEQENIEPTEGSNCRNEVAFAVVVVDVPTVEVVRKPVDANAVVARDLATLGIVSEPVDANAVVAPDLATLGIVSEPVDANAVVVPDLATLGIVSEPVDAKIVDDPVPELSTAGIVQLEPVDGFAGHLMDTSSESSRVDASMHCSEADANDDVDEPIQFLIDDIFEYLTRTRLPETWCWATNRRDEKSIIFIKVDPYTYELAFGLTLYNDLSVKAHTSDGKVQIELASIVTSIKSLERLLGEMGKKIVCRGSGMDEESRDGSCSGFVVLKKFDKQVTTPRCLFCRKLRQKIQNRNSKRHTTLKTRYARTRQRANLKQRGCKRLRAKSRKWNACWISCTEAR